MTLLGEGEQKFKLVDQERGLVNDVPAVCFDYP
jgi:hypothetical protein